MSFFVFSIFVFVVIAITGGFMASLVYAPRMSRVVRKNADTRPRVLGRP